jgi:threonine dehydratase
MPVAYSEIQAAAKRIAGQVIQSSCPRSIPLSEATALNVFRKLEFVQRSGSFKERCIIAVLCGWLAKDGFQISPGVKPL